MSFMKSVNFTRVWADGGEGRGHKRAGVQEKTGGEGERERKKERGKTEGEKMAGKKEIDRQPETQTEIIQIHSE